MVRKGSLAFAVDPAHPQRVTCGVTLAAPGAKTGGAGGPNKAGACDAASLASIASGTGSALVRGSSFALRYDASGNLVAKGDRTYEYDAENRLVRVREANGRIIESNVYDASGRRVVQDNRDGTTILIDGIYEIGKTHVSRHVYAGSALVATILAPRATVQFLDRPGTGPTGEVPLVALLGIVPLAGLEWLRRHPHRAMRAISVLAAVMLLAQAAQPAEAASSASEQRFYYHSDHLGSVNVVTDDKGKVTERRAYTPYGEAVDWSGAQSGPRELVEGYGGHRFDDATGLYYFGARHYDPQLGRFLTADTQVPDPLQPSDLHRYAFAADNPIRYVDPTGHAWYDWLLTIFVFVAAVLLTVLTFGAAAPLAFGVALAITIGAAFLGGVIGAIVASSLGLNPLNAEFWEQVLLGVSIGAAVGAGVAALFVGPSALAAVTTRLGFFAMKVGLGAMIGGATSSITAVIANYASGGSAHTLFGVNLAKQYFLGVGVGGAVGGVFGAGRLLFQGSQTLAEVAKASAAFGTLSKLARALDAVQWLWAGSASAFTGRQHTLVHDLWSLRGTTSQRVGAPVSAFSGTWPGRFGGDRASPLSPALATLPLAP